MVGAEPAQALLIDPLERRVASVKLDGERHGIPGDAHFADEDDLVAARPECAAKHLLGAAEAVVGRCVEQRHTQIDGAIDGGDHLVVVATAVLRVAHLPAAEPDCGDAEALVAELAMLHARQAFFSVYVPPLEAARTSAAVFAWRSALSCVASLSSMARALVNT